MDGSPKTVEPMEAPQSPARWLLRGALALTALTLIAVVVLTWMLQTRFQPLPVLSQLSEFTLTNQHGAATTLADLRGQVWIGDIIFTRCAGPCPQMTQRLARLQRLWPAQASVKLVSLTTDPDFDTPAVLKRYGERFGADPARWLFLTGSKAQLRGLAVDGLKLTAVDKAPAERTSPEDLFIHSTLFVLVDRQGRLRAIFDGTEPGFEAKVTRAVKQLLREPPA